MPDVERMIGEFADYLDEVAQRFEGDLDGELTHLWLVALERERIVTVAYRRDIIDARLAKMPVAEPVRDMVGRAIRWAWRDEERHALWIRGTLLQHNALPGRLQAWRTSAEGAVGGWVSSRQAHYRWSEAPLTRTAAELLEWAGRATGRVPDAVSGELHFHSFRDFCRFNVGAERTAELAWRRMGEIADDLQQREAFVAIADDEDRHARMFQLFCDSFDDDDHLQIASEALRAQLGTIGQRLLSLPDEGDLAWSNPLGKGGAVVIREGLDADEGPTVLQLVLDRLDVDDLLERRRPQTGALKVAIKTTFMLAVRRADPSPMVAPALLDALVRWLVDRGCQVSLIDARNIYDRFHDNRTVADVAAWIGLNRADRTIVDAQLDQQPHTYVRGLGQTSICAAWRDADVRIGFGKLRGHPTSVAMLGLEALEGLAERHDAFVFGRRQVDRSTAVLMVTDAFPPDVSLLDAYTCVPDGLLGMMGSEDPREPLRIYGSRDAVALDAVVARHIGANPDDEHMLLAGAFDWFGDPRPRVEVDGSDTPILGWRGPDHTLRSALLSRLAGPMFHHVSREGALFRPEVDEDAFPRIGGDRPVLDAARAAVQAVLAPSLPQARTELMPVSWTRLAGGAVRTVDRGQGTATVLLHGYPETLQIFARLAPRLPGRVVAFDWPGLGYSERWPGPAGPEALAGQLLALLDAWGIERVRLVARDMGGPAALWLAAEHPERVESVVVMNSLLFSDAPASWEIGLMRATSLNAAAFALAPGLVYRRSKRTFLRKGDALPEPLEADFLGAFYRPTVRRQLAAMCRDYEGVLADLPSRYWKIEVPVLALWAGAGHHFPVDHANRLAEIVPQAEVQVIDGAPHWMAWTHSDEVAAAITPFFAGLAAPR